MVWQAVWQLLVAAAGCLEHQAVRVQGRSVVRDCSMQRGGKLRKADGRPGTDFHGLHLHFGDCRLTDLALGKRQLHHYRSCKVLQQNKAQLPTA